MSEKVTHVCLGDKHSYALAWWEYDAQGIPLCKVCDKCKAHKLARYRPEVLRSYNQGDVEEPIEPDEV